MDGKGLVGKLNHLATAFVLIAGAAIVTVPADVCEDVQSEPKSADLSPYTPLDPLLAARIEQDARDDLKKSRPIRW